MEHTVAEVRHARWTSFNEKVQAIEGSYEHVAYSKLTWNQVKQGFVRTERHTFRHAKTPQEEIQCVYDDMQVFKTPHSSPEQGKEMTSKQFIAPIVISLTKWNKRLKISFEGGVNGNDVCAEGHCEFESPIDNKRFRIVDMKTSDVDQAKYELANVERLPAQTILTDFKTWHFYRSERYLRGQSRRFSGY
ncbi:unnamed protein product [Aphanomyces euteiches]|uniref:Uncharacterized protein n=1 Tax=Aphanomyces euteiches TaxID=100861 RepID=A0A6G0XW31_9STRA|nr:hypothetical protein Ae201684_001062 [Aphanomyces euteiches]KAH9099565.1 hypothetical protein Ae201684P_018578 [Aphanomyces euteiches]KAH9140157.1 hypothetical protein AeRB84_015540 [Aphanomyces euteiches]